jgi:voltage-gated potassium channel
MENELKRSVYTLLEPDDNAGFWDRVMDISMTILILLNVLFVILETIEYFQNKFNHFFFIFEIVSILIFSIDYILRVWSCISLEKYRHPFKGRLKYALSFWSIIDLLAIIPFFIVIFSSYDFRFLKIYRIFRFLRIMKLEKYLNSSKIIKDVFRSKKDELIICLLISFSLVIVVSGLMYFIEHDQQPNKFSSIPETMWWCVATLTTVGYGDVFPITSLGKFLTALISILGIGMFALPAGILASGFSSEFQKMSIKQNQRPCPHCGHEVTNED